VVVQDVSFGLQSGSALAIIGPSGSGQVVPGAALVGVWAPVRGKVRLDQAALDQWVPEALGRHIGYLPQDVELFDGTVAQNISRFRTGDDPDLVIQAAVLAGVHDLILRLPEGYETPSAKAEPRSLVGSASGLAWRGLSWRPVPGGAR
jgi:ATP-binding cassette subfamily C protein